MTVVKWVGSSDGSAELGSGVFAAAPTPGRRLTQTAVLVLSRTPTWVLVLPFSSFWTRFARFSLRSP